MDASPTREHSTVHPTTIVVAVVVPVVVLVILITVISVVISCSVILVVLWFRKRCATYHTDECHVRFYVMLCMWLCIVHNICSIYIYV